jgi:hypothetical protein
MGDDSGFGCAFFDFVLACSQSTPSRIHLQAMQYYAEDSALHQCSDLVR